MEGLIPSISPLYCTFSQLPFVARFVGVYRTPFAFVCRCTSIEHTCRTLCRTPCRTPCRTRTHLTRHALPHTHHLQALYNGWLIEDAREGQGEAPDGAKDCFRGSWLVGYARADPDVHRVRVDDGAEREGEHAAGASICRARHARR